MTPDAAHAARDVVRAVAILIRLAEGPATLPELRQVSRLSRRRIGWTLHRLLDLGLIVALPGERVRWALATDCPYPIAFKRGTAAGMPPAFAAIVAHALRVDEAR